MDITSNIYVTAAARLSVSMADIKTLSDQQGDPLDQAAAFQRSADHATAMVAVSVWQARKAGTTWQVIGDALGISRQAAQQRFGH